MKLCSTGINVTGSDGEECLRSLISPLIAGAIRNTAVPLKIWEIFLVPTTRE